MIQPHFLVFSDGKTDPSHSKHFVHISLSGTELLLTLKSLGIWIISFHSAHVVIQKTFMKINQAGGGPRSLG
jgi:hypothetical protein